MTDLDLADQWLDTSMRAFEIAMAFRRRARAARDRALEDAARALAAERAAVRLESAIHHRLDVERYRAGEMA